MIFSPFPELPIFPVYVKDRVLNKSIATSFHHFSKQWFQNMMDKTELVVKLKSYRFFSIQVIYIAVPSPSRVFLAWNMLH